MPRLTIRGESFECRDLRVGWRLIELARKVEDATPMAVYMGYADFLTEMLEPAEVDRFKQHLDTVGADLDDIEESFSALVKEYADRPTEKSASSSASQPEAPAPLRVVDLSQGTHPASSDPGHSKAS